MNVDKVMSWLVVFGVLAMAGKASAQPDASALATGPNLVGTLAWDSHYVSEGRENLDGDSLVGGTFEAGVGNLTLGLLYAESPGQDYREFNVYAAYGLEWGGFEGYIAYNHLQFLEDDEHDNEIGMGIAYTALPLNLSVGLDATYSFESEGTFIEACLCGEYTIHEKLILRPSAVLGLNARYITDGHDGANHGEVRFEAAIPLAAHIELTGYLASSWAIDADPDRYPDDASLKDFVYGGVTLQIATP